MLKAGTCLIDVTPPQGLELAGYPHYPRYNEGAHDPLYAAAMYLNNGECEIAMVTIDILFFSKKHVAEVRRRVNAACGIPAENIMISCSHTHSGPWAAGRLDIESLEAGLPQPHEYVEELDQDLGSVEEDLYFTDEDDEDDYDDYDDDEDYEGDDAEYYEIECPSCGETVCFDSSLEPDDVVCPACGEKIGDVEICDGECSACENKVCEE